MKSPSLVYRSEAPLTAMQELCSSQGISWDSPYEDLTETEIGELNAWIDEFDNFRYDNDNVGEMA